jgi:hypothetical protein
MNREMRVFVDRLPWKLRPGQGEERVRTRHDIGELSSETFTVSIYPGILTARTARGEGQ